LSVEIDHELILLSGFFYTTFNGTASDKYFV
jgi:hypothetical protein